MRIPWKRLALALIGMWVLGCQTARPASTCSQAMVLSLQNVTCADCGKGLESRATRVPGVCTAAFDEKTVELRLQVKPDADPQAIIRSVTAEPIDGSSIAASSGAGHGSYAPFTEPDPGSDVKSLSPHGEDVADLGTLAAAGKVTIVDFYADWCGPCHVLDEHIHELLSKRPGLAYRRLNVVDWDSPLARHHLTSVRELPYVIVYDGRAKVVARFSAPDPHELDAAVARAEAR